MSDFTEIQKFQEAQRSLAWEQVRSFISSTLPRIGYEIIDTELNVVTGAEEHRLLCQHFNIDPEKLSEEQSEMMNLVGLDRESFLG